MRQSPGRADEPGAGENRQIEQRVRRRGMNEWFDEEVDNCRRGHQAGRDQILRDRRSRRAPVLTSCCTTCKSSMATRLHRMQCLRRTARGSAVLDSPQLERDGFMSTDGSATRRPHRSRCSITASCTAKASTRRCARTTRDAVPLRAAHARACARSAALHGAAGAVRRRRPARAHVARRWRRTRSGLDEAYIRILLTRGVGELTYNLAATPDAHARDHRQALPGAAGAHVHGGDPPVAGRRPAQSSARAESDDQVEQPAEQRAGDAGGAAARAPTKR